MARPTLRILVVDDEEGVKLAIESILRHFGHEVIGETDPVQAIETFSDSTFDLVTLDFMMPGVNGLALARRLREIRPDIPLILISALLDDCAPEEIERVGFQAVVSKPFRAQDIVGAVELCRDGVA